MRITVYAGWFMAALGVAFLVGAGTQDQLAFGLLMLGGLSGPGLFMVWLGHGWDKPLENAAELYRYGRPANATVRKVADVTLDADGTRTAKLSVRVTPRNESAYKTTQRVALPGGRVPSVGEAVTVKFDPNSRRQFVLLEESYEVVDHVQDAVGMINRLAGTPRP
jgi:sporulation protein YlmC with PRC-barrel domain